MMPNLIPPKIPDGEKVDFDVREKEKQFFFKKIDLFPKWLLLLMSIENVCHAKVVNLMSHAGYPS